jgi:hypothetical protein
MFEKIKIRGRRNEITRPIEDLLFDQRKGKLLTLKERLRIKKYAEDQRIKKQRR